MYLVEPKPMPGNNPQVGDTSGLWRVMFADLGITLPIPQNPAQRTHAENLPYEEAARIANELEKKLNS
jgi:hypothetical protein